ncbi:hypothetical protein RSAG8_09183, partial [Rhizoctonia solani AG-8 WAC10335]
MFRISTTRDVSTLKPAGNHWISILELAGEPHLSSLPTTTRSTHVLQCPSSPGGFRASRAPTHRQ